jgi:YVTN family beta-propeller protein
MPLDKIQWRPIIIHSGGTVKYAFLLLAISCSLSAVHAQWLETIIQLDSGSNPQALCYNAANDKVYCANAAAGNVTVIDAETNDVITTVSVGGSPCDICYSVTLNKVYCAGNVVTVIDGLTDSVVATIDPGVGVLALCYNPQNNKLYGGRDDPDVTVMDCEGDSVLAAVPAWGSPLAFCYNPHNNKAYYAAHFGDHVGVIDGATDSLLAEVLLAPGSDPRAVCYDPTDNKVYCSARNGDKVIVIDGDSDSIAAEVNVGHTHALCYCQQGNKVYVTLNFGGVAAIDCVTDSVVATIPSQQGSEVILFNAKSNKVFCAGLSEVAVIDAAADTVLRTIEVGGFPIDLCYSPVHNRVYVASAYNSTISVLADSMSGIEEAMNDERETMIARPTIIRSLPQGAVDFDAMGRRVVNPRAGVFFVRGEGQGAGDVGRTRKVVIQR